MRFSLLVPVGVLVVCGAPLSADTINFSTFVPGPSIAAVEGGNNSTIAFNYAGNKFVGSVYFGADNNQLYATDLSGGSVTQFGSPIPGASAEVVIGASLGNGGFATGNIFAGSGAGGDIYQYANAGGAPSLFTTLPSGAGAIRQIFFDPGSSFGGNMLVSTTSGQIYQVDSTGSASFLANVGEDAEGTDIAPSTWGPYAGDLLVGSESSGTVRLISPGGTVTVVGAVGEFPSAETVSAIPTNLDNSNPLEGFYVANYPNDVQFASASQFISQGLLGDMIVTAEQGGSRAWDVHYDSGTGLFSSTPFTFPGNQINQFEDGIFVSPQRVSDVTSPEPGTMLLLAGALAAGLLAKRTRRS